jgi:hypothetical protein
MSSGTSSRVEGGRSWFKTKMVQNKRRRKPESIP